ncbi:MAG: DUF5615 family PIN-like protein [Syntrophobacteraceae bacterium]|nr:DUF5615 family PIN-like protein [Syntrophobacteraceae bacterium]
MRFLVDECTGPAVARWLRAQQHDVFSVYEEAIGMDDEEVIQRAFGGNRTFWRPSVVRLYRDSTYALVRQNESKSSNPADVFPHGRGSGGYVRRGGISDR